MFLKKNIIQHQQNIEKLIIDYKLLKKAMNFLYKKRIIKAGGINMIMAMIFLIIEVFKVNLEQ